MAYDEALAERIRKSLGPRKDIEAKTMFGGIGFLLNGNMCVGVQKDSLIVRLDPARADDALREKHVGEFKVGGRAMKGWLLVAPEGLRDDDRLNGWIRRGVEFAQTLPPK
jgi:TfoX/Sxy family transcriptional regulator of competence genes